VAVGLEGFPGYQPANGRSRGNPRKQLRVMKFGGTSVADAACIGKVLEIIRASSRESSLVVVVSAMRGVTNKLIEAATQSEAGNLRAFAAIFEELRNQHDTAVNALIHSPAERDRLGRKLQALFEEIDRLCQGTMLIRELTPRASDSISSLGERLSAPLVAAALSEREMPSEAVEATELIVTDSYHGGAEPKMDLTSERCKARLGPLLQNGIVPVVTGFIGVTEAGVRTTLGRGGSDYSATILGAALDADEVVIWKDVDGLQTADPLLVPGSCTIREISYREASELAYFGAKVLHPKTLRAVMQRGIPLWVRNTFAPERPGTKITPLGSQNGGGVRALTAISDVALITLGGMIGIPDVLGRTLAVTTALRADVLMSSQSSSQNDTCLVISASLAQRTVEALRREFAHDLAQEPAEHIFLDSSVAIVSVVGQKMRRASGVIGRTFAALGRENVQMIAIAQSSSECNISFLIAKQDMKTALRTIHREFQLSGNEFASTIATTCSDATPLSVA
jgi:aspartate kinase